MAQPSFETSLTTGISLTRDYTTGISIVNALHTASGEYGIRIQNTFTYATAGVHKGISSEVTYSPTTQGYATPIAIAAKVALGANFTGGTGYVWGIQGQLDLGTSRTINNASAVLAGLRGVITGSGTVDTECQSVSCIYCDNLNSANLNGFSTGHSSFISIQNSGGIIDSAFRIRAGDAINYLFRFDDYGHVAGSSDMIQAGAAKSGASGYIAIDVAGTEYFINIYQ